MWVWKYFSSPVPSIRRHRGHDDAFSSPVPSSRRRCGYDDAFSSPVPSISCRHGHGSAFSSPVPSIRRHRGHGSAFSSPVPSISCRCGYDDAFPSPVPSFQRHRGHGSAFSLLYPLPGVLHTLTNSLTRPLLGGSFHICTSFLSTGLPHPAQLPLQPLHPPQHCPLLSLRSSPRTIKKTVIAIIVIIMMSAISASCPYLCSAFGYI